MKKGQGTKPNILVRLLAFVVSAALVLGAAAAVVYRDSLSLDSFRRWLAYRSMETGEDGQTKAFTHGGGEQLQLACLEGGFLFASAAGAHYYASNGEEMAGQIVSLDKPVLSASARAGVVYEAGGESLFLFSGREQTFSWSPDRGGILSARVNDSGWLAITAQASRQRGRVTVFNAHQEEIITLNYSSSFVVDAAVSPDCRTVAVVTMDQSGGAFQSHLLLCSIGDGQTTASVDLEGFAVLDLDFDSAGVWLLGQDSLSVVSPYGGETHSFYFSPSYLKDCSLGGDGFAVLLLGRYRAGQAREAVSVGPNGEVQARRELSGQVLDLSASGRYTALLTGREVCVYDSTLELSGSAGNDRGARRAAVYNDGSVLLADDQQAWLYIP